MRVVVDDAALADAAEAAWSRCREPQRFSAEAEPVTARTPGTPERIPPTLQGLTQTITRALIRAQTGRLLMFHAGAVSHPGMGESLVFVAPGGTGKTTLARTLGNRYGDVTDETVDIDPATGIIHPLPEAALVAHGGPAQGGGVAGQAGPGGSTPGCGWHG